MELNLNMTKLILFIIITFICNYVYADININSVSCEINDTSYPCTKMTDGSSSSFWYPDSPSSFDLYFDSSNIIIGEYYKLKLWVINNESEDKEVEFSIYAGINDNLTFIKSYTVIVNRNTSFERDFFNLKAESSWNHIKVIPDKIIGVCQVKLNQSNIIINSEKTEFFQYQTINVESNLNLDYYVWKTSQYYSTSQTTSSCHARNCNIQLPNEFLIKLSLFDNDSLIDELLLFADYPPPNIDSLSCQPAQPFVNDNVRCQILPFSNYTYYIVKLDGIEIQKSMSNSFQNNFTKSGHYELEIQTYYVDQRSINKKIFEINVIDYPEIELNIISTLDKNWIAKQEEPFNLSYSVSSEIELNMEWYIDDTPQNMVAELEIDPNNYDYGRHQVRLFALYEPNNRINAFKDFYFTVINPMPLNISLSGKKIVSLNENSGIYILHYELNNNLNPSISIESPDNTNKSENIFEIDYDKCPNGINYIKAIVSTKEFPAISDYIDYSFIKLDYPDVQLKCNHDVVLKGNNIKCLLESTDTNWGHLKYKWHVNSSVIDNVSNELNYMTEKTGYHYIKARVYLEEDNNIYVEKAHYIEVKDPNCYVDIKSKNNSFGWTIPNTKNIGVNDSIDIEIYSNRIFDYAYNLEITDHNKTKIYETSGELLKDQEQVNEKVQYSNIFNTLTEYDLNVHVTPMVADGSSSYSVNKFDKFMFVPPKMNMSPSCIKTDENQIKCTFDTPDTPNVEQMNWGIINLDIQMKIGTTEVFYLKSENIILSEIAEISIPYTYETSKANIIFTLEQCFQESCLQSVNYETVSLLLNEPIVIKEIQILGDKNISTNQKLPQMKINYEKDHQDRVGLREFYLSTNGSNFEKIKSSYSDSLTLDNQYSETTELKIKARVYHRLDSNKYTDSEEVTLNIIKLSTIENVLNPRCQYSKNYIKCNLSEMPVLTLNSELKESMDETYFLWELKSNNETVKKSNRSYLGFEPGFIDYTLYCNMRTNCGRNITGKIELNEMDYKYKVLGTIDLTKVNPVITLNELNRQVEVKIYNLSINDINKYHYSYSVEMGDATLYTNTTSFNHTYQEEGNYKIEIKINREDNKNYSITKDIVIRNYEDIINDAIRDHFLDFRLSINPPLNCSVFRYIEASKKSEVYKLLQYIDYEINIPVGIQENISESTTNFKRYTFDIDIQPSTDLNAMYYEMIFYEKNSNIPLLTKKYYFSEKFQSYSLNDSDISIIRYSGKIKDYANIDIKSFIKIKPKEVNKYISGIEWQLSQDNQSWFNIAGGRYQLIKNIDYNFNRIGNVYIRAKIYCLYNDTYKYSNTLDYVVDESLPNIIAQVKYNEYVQYGKKYSVANSDIPNQLLIGENVVEYNWSVNDNNGNTVRSKLGKTNRDKTYVFELSKTGNYTITFTAETNLKRVINGYVDFRTDIIEGSNPDFESEFDMSQIKFDCTVLSHTKKEVAIEVSNIRYLKNYQYYCNIDLGNGQIISNIERTNNKYTYSQRGSYQVSLNIYDKNNNLVGSKESEISIIEVPELFSMCDNKGLIKFSSKVINPFKKQVKVKLDMPYYLRNEIQWHFEILSDNELPTLTKYENSVKEYIDLPVTAQGEYKFICTFLYENNELKKYTEQIIISENMPINELFDFDYYVYKSRKGYGYTRFYLNAINKKELYGYDWKLSLFDYDNQLLKDWDNRVDRMVYKFDIPGNYYTKLIVTEEASRNVLYEENYIVQINNKKPIIEEIKQNPFVYRNAKYNRIQVIATDDDGKIKRYEFNVCGKLYNRSSKKTFSIPEDCQIGIISVYDDMGASCERIFQIEQDYQ